MRMTDRLLCCSVTLSVARSPLSTPPTNGAISTKAYHFRKEKETCIGYLDSARTKRFIRHDIGKVISFAKSEGDKDSNPFDPRGNVA